MFLHGQPIIALVLFLLLPFLRIEARSYAWTASIDRVTGIATSREVSTVPKPLRNHIATFSSYPTWLAKPSVTFGLLDAKKNTTNGATMICVRYFGSELLTFGQAVIRDKNTVELPIRGGLLAQINAKKRQHGSLIFRQTKNQMIETQIQYGYRPSILGPAPVPLWRGLAYGGSQSVIHAYVMWRFHRFCYSEDHKVV
jgi:hypothetical protein